MQSTETSGRDDTLCPRPVNGSDTPPSNTRFEKAWGETFGSGSDVQHVRETDSKAVKLNGSKKRKPEKKHCTRFGGVLCYADKPISFERPRAISPELLKFYFELEFMGR